jgi:hypothetical protein
MKLDQRKIDWNPIFICIFPALLLLLFLPSEISFYRSSEIATGTVIALNSGGYKPQVEFSTRRGEVISVPASSFIHKTAVGEKLAIRYDPTRPRIARINQVFSLFGWAILLLVLISAFMLKGLLSAITWKTEK